MYAENHGIIANEFYDPEFKDTYCLCKPEAVNDPRWYSGEPIWVTAEKQGVKTASFYWVGSTTPVGGVLPGITKQYVESVPFETRVDSVAAWFSLPEEERPHLVLLYFHEPDATGHDYGPDSEETGRMVSRLDSLFSTIVGKMNSTPVADKLNIIVVSDHGMAETSHKRTIDYSKEPGLEGFIQEGTGPTAFFYGKDEKIEEARDLLDGSIHAKAYLKNDIPVRWHYKNNNRIKDILVVAEEGWSILNTKDPDTSSVSSGTHGFDNALWSMHGIFLGSGPAFKKGYRKGPVENIHIYPLIAKILGLTPAPGIDGNLSKVEELLSKQKK